MHPQQEVRHIPALRAVPQVEDAEAQMVVLGPGSDRRVFLGDVGGVFLPPAVYDDVTDLGVLGGLHHLGRIPGAHVPGRPDRPLTIEHRLEPVGALLDDVLHEVLGDLVDVQRQ